MYVVNNLENYHRISSVIGFMRYKNQLHRLMVKLSCFQRGVLFSAIKIFNSFPSTILECKNNKPQFKATLRRFLVANSFCSLAENLHSVK
jgi:hypothetical protein